MKYIIIVAMFLNSNVCLSQLNWGYTIEQKRLYREHLDNMPLKLKDSISNFKRAMILLESDSITKAGMIFERLMLLDSTSKIGRESKSLLINIEKQLTNIFEYRIQGIWSEYECLSAEIRYGNKNKRIHKSEKLKINNGHIVFEENLKIVGDKKYKSSIKFDWFYGTAVVYLIYDDNDTTLIYFLQSPTRDYIFDTITFKTSQMNYNIQKCYTKE